MNPINDSVATTLKNNKQKRMIPFLMIYNSELLSKDFLKKNIKF